MFDWSVGKTTCPDEEIRLSCVELYNKLTFYDLLKYGDEEREKRCNTRAMYDEYNNMIKELTKWHYGVPITIIYLIKAPPVFTVDEDTLVIVQTVEYLNGKASILNCDEALGDEVSDYLADDEDE